MPIQDNQVGIYSKKNTIIIRDTETIGYVINEMIKYNIRHFPVLSTDNVLQGVISAIDVIQSMHDIGSSDFLQENITSALSHDFATANSDERVRDVINMMYNFGIDSVPILSDDHIDGMFTDKDIVLLDPLWAGLKDEIINEGEGIGRIIGDTNVITEEFTIWQASDKILQSGQRQLMVKHSETGKYEGVITVMRILSSLIPTLISEGSDISVLHSTTVDSIIKESFFTEKIPCRVSAVRTLMNKVGVEAIPVFAGDMLIKLVTEKDLVAYAANLLNVE
ncbi:MAG: CBS domain-containing protein [Candidatus Heimdallarchaeota archaeon]|nr:CBS domain-containing protein [Candidatus Heimdallarchaeota archaeon]MDH5646470.1 CBS domain-containing protein [Candidatus Heimdallarchaeota archaeon]